MNLKEKSKQHTFDSYCKKILKNEARDYYDYLKVKKSNEISLDELTDGQLEQLSKMPEHEKPSRVIPVLQYAVDITDSDVADALLLVPEDKREIILLYYFLDMNDQEIAIQLDLIRRTVQYRRKTTLKLLKKILEQMNNE